MVVMNKEEPGSRTTQNGLENLKTEDECLVLD